MVFNGWRLNILRQFYFKSGEDTTSVTRQGRTLSNDKGVNTSRRYNNYKCISQHPSSEIY